MTFIEIGISRWGFLYLGDIFKGGGARYNFLKKKQTTLINGGFYEKVNDFGPSIIVHHNFC